MAEIEIDFHKVSQIELCERFNTNTKTGISHDDAAKGLEKHGPNLITPPPTTPYCVKCLFSQWLPWLIFAICFIAYKVGFSMANYYLCMVICGLTLIDRGYSFLSERQVRKSHVGLQRVHIGVGTGFKEWRDDE